MTWVAEKHAIYLPPIEERDPESVNRILSKDWVEIFSKGLDSCGTSIRPDCMFDAILIDEGQDFERDWIRVVQRFLNPAWDQFLVVYDPAQNIYGRDIEWLIGTPDKLGFNGSTKELLRTHRLPSAMADIVQHIASKYGLDVHPEPVPGPHRGGNLGSHYLWGNISDFEENSPAVLRGVLRTVKYFSSERDVHPGDMAILTTTERVGLPIVACLTQHGYRVTHVFDETRSKDYRKRRDNKWRFQPGNGQIKVSTINSFKGWESPCIILVLTPIKESGLVAEDHGEFWDSAAYLYVAITRLQSIEKSTGYFVCLNACPELQDVEEIFARYSLGVV